MTKAFFSCIVMVVLCVLTTPAGAAPQPYRFPQPFQAEGYLGGFMGYANYSSRHEKIRGGHFTIGAYIGAQKLLNEHVYVGIHKHMEWDTMGFDESCLEIETVVRITEQCVEFESEFSGAIAATLGYQFNNRMRIEGRVGLGYTYAARNLEKRTRDRINDRITVNEDTLDSEFFTGIHSTLAIAMPRAKNSRRITYLEASFNHYGDRDSLYDIENRFSVIVSQRYLF